MEKDYYVYVLSSSRQVLYIGVTGDLPVRIWQHKNEPKGFVKKYNINTLVYYEVYDDIEYAIQREKQMKKWNREWKMNLIIEKNPEWRDLYHEILQ